MTIPIKSIDFTKRETTNNKLAKFVARVVPWPGDQHSPGVVNLHWFSPKGPGMRGRPTRSVQQFLNELDSLKAKPLYVSDIYYCLSLQKNLGRVVRGSPVAARHSRDAIALKAIWLDIDIKDPPKGYETLDLALGALENFLKATGLPGPNAIVGSGGGLHVYWISNKALTVQEWEPYAQGLKAAAMNFGLRCDVQCTIDAARVLRVPDTWNCKSDPKRPVKLLALTPADHDFETALAKLRGLAPAVTGAVTDAVVDLSAFIGKKPADIFLREKAGVLGAGVSAHSSAPLDPAPILRDCPFFADAWRTGGKDHSQGLWNLTVLASTFMQRGEHMARKFGDQHPGYTPASTKEMYDRKERERDERGLGWPHCKSFQGEGAKQCATCPHFGKIKSPLHLALNSQATAPAPSPPLQPSFVDPYSEFVGPEFPLDVLPPTLAGFVDAEHRVMGADRSAIAMAALTAVAGAMHAETRVRVGEGWWEKPILWTALLGQPSAKKSPIIEKTTKSLSSIDHNRKKLWDQAHAQWQTAKQAKVAPLPPSPPKPSRCVINDITPEKVAEILSREPSGSLMVHDELAGWLGSFERYSSGASSRAFYLSCWNGGPHVKDRVGKGANDLAAEIRVDNLALCVLGGIQPDRLAKLRDLTDDGLLQRFLPVLMAPAKRGDEYHPVAAAEADYEKLINAINIAPAQNYVFEDDALEVRDRMFDYLHGLETVDSFSSALIGAIGKLKGYFARISLVLQVARQYDPLAVNDPPPFDLSGFVAGPAPVFANLDPKIGSLSAGINTSRPISRGTAEAAEKIIRQFVLPHIFGLYDVVNGGQDRDMVRSIANFILASNEHRLRPSDFSKGVRALRGQPEQKIREWVGRFCVMDWLEPEEGKPGVPPKAWLVQPKLREHFAERRKCAEAARAEAHKILKAGGSRRGSSAGV